MSVSAVRRSLEEAAALNIFTHIVPDRQAPEPALGDSRSLAGKTLAVKDNIAVRDLPLTCASEILRDYISPYSATAVERLEAAGATIVGKTNLDEFAMGSSSEFSIFGAVRNPVDPERVAGGSSGGSAAAVAGGFVDLALGSDTGGSVRQPASFCGVVGLKPTYGRVSRYGLVAFASSLDQIGVLSPTVMDAARALESMAGFDPRDATSVKEDVPAYSAQLEKLDERLAAKLRIGIPAEYFGEGLQQDVRERIDTVIDRLKSLGCTMVPVSLPHTPLAIAMYYIISAAEASSNLARYDGVRYGKRAQRDDVLEMYTRTREAGFGPEVKRRILLGTYVLSAGYYDAYYVKAQQVRRLLKEDFQSAFQQVDLLLTPTAPTTAFKLGSKLEDPLAMYLNDIYTVSMNLSGIPAMSIPVGVDDRNLPIGCQLAAPAFAEETIFQLGTIIERFDWS